MFASRRSIESDPSAVPTAVYGTSFESEGDLSRRYKNASANAIFIDSSAGSLELGNGQRTVGSMGHRTFSSRAWMADPDAAIIASSVQCSAELELGLGLDEPAPEAPSAIVIGRAIYLVDAIDVFETFCKRCGVFELDLIVFNFPYAGIYIVYSQTHSLTFLTVAQTVATSAAATPSTPSICLATDTCLC